MTGVAKIGDPASDSKWKLNSRQRKLFRRCGSNLSINGFGLKQHHKIRKGQGGECAGEAHGQGRKSAGGGINFK